jgi:hypothetical protein
VATLFEMREGVLVFSPERAAEARAHGGPSVAFMPVVTRLAGWMVADGAYDHVAVFADAYASDDETLAAAIAFVRSEDRDARRRGPLRLTSLGTLGEWRPRDAPPIGSALEIAGHIGRMVIGRSPSASINLRQGGHSDQNTVARIHAIIEKAADGLLVTDAKSTNGTWLNGRRIESSASASVGDEIAIACTHRFRIDGSIEGQNAKSPTP